MGRAMREQWLTRMHDRNRDGKLDEQERAAMEADRTRQEERARTMREQNQKMRS